MTTATPAAAGADGSKKEELEPEVLAAIAAAVAAFLGKNFRLLSVSHQDQMSRWTRQGRAVVQASHTVRRTKR